MAQDDDIDETGDVDGDETPRSGRVAIVGRPNVGKSTLMNALLGQRLAIITAKPGTTRSSLLGVYSAERPPTQIAFIDTPGMGLSKSALHQTLTETAQASLADVDAVLLVTDHVPKKGSDVHAGDEAVLEACAQTGKPIIVAINKVDTVKPRDLLLPVLSKWSDTEGVVAVVPISATKGTNVKPLVKELRARLPEGLLYEEDILTDKPMRFFAAELVREAAMERTREEVPYGVAVVVDEYDEQPQITRIHASLVVEKPAHKGIVIGKGGTMLKEIGTAARKRIEEMTGQKVFLELFVKVIPGWTRDPRRVRELLGGEEAS
jgi:GTP-binding protein Era